MTQIAYFLSPIGPVRIEAEAGFLARIEFTDQMQDALTKMLLPGDPVNWLAAYFAGKRPDPACLPLAPAGSCFSLAVWREIAAIPYGQRDSYGGIAGRLGTSARAVGQAAGRNPLALVVPCHRVTGAGGRLTGYASGLWRKEWLLRHEDSGNYLSPTTKARG